MQVLVKMQFGLLSRDILFMPQIFQKECRKNLQRKFVKKNLKQKSLNELCSFTELQNLNDKGPYDLIFSNFAGLNCTGELDKVLHSFSPLLKPNGRRDTCNSS